MQMTRVTPGRRSCEGGYALLEVLVAVALLAACAGAFGAAAGLHGTAARALEGGEALASRVALAEQVARQAPALTGTASTIGSGATLSLAPSEGGGWTLALYAARPIMATLPSARAGRPRPPLVERVAIAGRMTSDIGGDAPFSLFFSSSGTVAAAAWQPGDPPPAAEPRCSRVSLSVADGPARQTYAIDCSTGALSRMPP